VHCGVVAGVEGGAEFARRSAITRGISQDRMRYEISDSRTKLQVSDTPLLWQTVSVCPYVNTASAVQYTCVRLSQQCFLWVVTLLHWVIGSWRFETTFWSYHQVLKCLVGGHAPRHKAPHTREERGPQAGILSLHFNHLTLPSTLRIENYHSRRKREYWEAVIGPE